MNDKFDSKVCGRL